MISCYKSLCTKSPPYSYKDPTTVTRTGPTTIVPINET